MVAIRMRQAGLALALIAFLAVPALAQQQMPGSMMQQEMAPGQMPQEMQGRIVPDTDPDMAQEMNTRYGPLAWLPIHEVIGAEVRDRQGGVIGQIVEVVRDPAADTAYAVLELTGQQVVVAPIDAFTIDQNQEIVLTPAAQEQIAGMPAYDAARFQPLAPGGMEAAPQPAAGPARMPGQPAMPRQ